MKRILILTDLKYVTAARGWISEFLQDLDMPQAHNIPVIVFDVRDIAGVNFSKYRVLQYETAPRELVDHVCRFASVYQVTDYPSRSRKVHSAREMSTPRVVEEPKPLVPPIPRDYGFVDWDRSVGG